MHTGNILDAYPTSCCSQALISDILVSGCWNKMLHTMIYSYALHLQLCLTNTTLYSFSATITITIAPIDTHTYAMWR